MRRCGIAAMCVWFLVGTGAVSAQNPVPGEDALAAESLLHSAANLYHMPTAAARAGRLVAISRYLAELAPNDIRTQRLLADVYQSHGELDAAAAAARRLLDAFPDDYAAGVRWLRFRLNLIQVAPERVKMLQSVVDQADLPEALRSVAAAEMARVLLGEGAQDDAVKAVDRALQLDPLNHTALLRRLELTEKPAPADYVRTMLALLKGNPRAYWVARELAGQLADLGLHEQALAYYRQAWKIVQGPQAPLRDAPVGFACEYLSALLDADQPSVAVELFSPSLERLKDSAEFVSLMIEALRDIGRDAQAEPLIRQVERFYRRQVAASKMAADAQTQEDRKKQEARAAADQAVNLAWFYLLVDRQPQQARRYAAEARQWGAQGEAVDLLSGAADLAAGHPEGQKQLTGLAEKYPLAAAFLAKFEFDQNRPEPAKALLLKGLQSKRRDLAYRMLLALAKEHKVPLPPVPGAQEAGKLVDSFDPRVLEMGVEPGKFLRIDIQPAAESVSLCEPIVVEGKLTATGDLPIPVGEWGLLEPRLGLELRVGREAKASFATMPMVIWPVPRQLQPGRSISASTRVDIGPVAQYLANHPLEAVELVVRAMPSPREQSVREQESSTVVSALPMIQPETPAILRRGLLPDRTAEGYRAAVADLERQLASGELAQRVTAARRVAALLSWIHQAEKTREGIPATVQPAVDRRQLLGLMGAALRDPAAVVRAEIITALEYADMGDAMLNEVGLVVEDPSPLVRFRVAELIGASGTKGNRTLIDLYAKDPDPQVRLMAQAFLHEWRKERPASQPVLAPATTQPTKP